MYHPISDYNYLTWMALLKSLKSRSYSCCCISWCTWNNVNSLIQILHIQRWQMFIQQGASVVVCWITDHYHLSSTGCLCGSALDHRSLPPEFKSWRGHILRHIFDFPSFFWWVPLWSSSSVLDHISLPPVFESRHGHI